MRLTTLLPLVRGIAGTIALDPSQGPALCAGTLAQIRPILDEAGDVPPALAAMLLATGNRALQETITGKVQGGLCPTLTPDGTGWKLLLRTTFAFADGRAPCGRVD